MTDRCEVCGFHVDTETDFDKFDPRAPVIADDYVYHLGCEDGILDNMKQNDTNHGSELWYVAICRNCDQMFAVPTGAWDGASCPHCESDDVVRQSNRVELEAYDVL